MWFRCVNVVFFDNEKKTMSLKFNYLSGNIIGLVWKRVCSACNKPLSKITPQALSSQLRAYLWNKNKIGIFQLLNKEHGLGAPSQRQSPIPSIGPTRSVGGVD